VRAYLAEWKGNSIENFDFYASMGRSSWNIDLNEEYDFYTKHGRNGQVQLLYDKKIDSMLSIYSAFKDTLIILPLAGRR